MGQFFLRNDITTWSQKIEEHLAKADEITRRVQNEIKAIDNEEEEKQAIEKHKMKMAFERELLEQKENLRRTMKNSRPLLKRPSNSNYLQQPNFPN